MLKLIGLSLLLLSVVGARAQSPPALNVFTNPDGAFQFSYPENYELLFGERILKATQGRHVGFPVCDFSQALVCVIYPIERLANDKLEAAGLSLNVAPGVPSESDCLEYTDRFARPNNEVSQPSPFTIKGRVFQHASGQRRMDGHSQSSDLYRTFQKGRCYELRIEVSLSDENTARPRAPKLLDGAVTDNARESFKLILSSVVFR